MEMKFHPKAQMGNEISQIAMKFHIAIAMKFH